MRGEGEGGGGGKVENKVAQGRKVSGDMNAHGVVLWTFPRPSLLREMDPCYSMYICTVYIKVHN